MQAFISAVHFALVPCMLKSRCWLLGGHVVHRQQGATVLDPPRTDDTNAASYWIHGFKESLELEELTNFAGGADAIATLLRHLVDR